MSAIFNCCLSAVTCLFIGGLSSGPAAAVDVVAKLGQPRRNVSVQVRPVQLVAQQLASREVSTSGVIPLMIFPSGSMVVENVFPLVKSAGTCRSTFAAYDKELRAEHGSKIKHGLYCVTIANGSLKSIDTVAKSF